MARILIVGCGCRGIELAAKLQADGHAVRGTTRTDERVQELEKAGIEAWVGDPDRIASIHYSMENATIMCWMLGSAEAEDGSLESLHGTRLQMMLERTIDTTVRGVIYEGAGTVKAEYLTSGAADVERICGKNEIPWSVVTADPADSASWSESVKAQIDELLTRDRG